MFLHPPLSVEAYKTSQSVTIHGMACWRICIHLIGSSHERALGRVYALRCPLRQTGREGDEYNGTTAYRGWIPRHGVYRGISALSIFGLGYWVCSLPPICAFGWAQSRPGTMGSFHAELLSVDPASSSGMDPGWDAPGLASEGWIWWYLHSGFCGGKRGACVSVSAEVRGHVIAGARRS